jgi:hypothetical protein
VRVKHITDAGSPPSILTGLENSSEVPSLSPSYLTRSISFIKTSNFHSHRNFTERTQGMIIGVVKKILSVSFS